MTPNDISVQNGRCISPDSTLSDNGALMTKTWLLTAGETDATSLMPITLVANRSIQLATEHANALGIGYSQLAEHNIGWVLARLSIQMVRYPQINESYTMSTWIEGINRYFSDRCYEMTDMQGRPLAYIRSVWVAIDMDSRAMADLSQIDKGKLPVYKRLSPVAKSHTPMIAPGAPTTRSYYTFKYCDIDLNRHVNTIRYLDLVLNLYSLDFFDHNKISRLDVAFEHECYYGERVALLTGDSRGEDSGRVTELHSLASGKRAVAVNIVCVPRD